MWYEGHLDIQTIGYRNLSYCIVKTFTGMLVFIIEEYGTASVDLMFFVDNCKKYSRR